jgi:hypothetical protein
VTQNKPFIVTAQHAGADTTGYRLYVDGVVVDDKPVSALANGTISFAHPGLPRGSHVIEPAAYNVDGEAKAGPTTAVMLGTPPVPPINVQIVIVS